MPVPVIYRTMTMIGAIQALPTHRTFLRDRYFPCTPATDMFPTEEVLIEYRDGNKKIAPVVAPRKGGVTIKREGYTTRRYAPPLVAPKRGLTIDDLNKRGFGEDLYSQITPEQREAQVLGNDLTELSTMIDGREEYMAASAMLNNGYVLKQYADDYGEKNEEFELFFYDGESDDSKYTPSGHWTDVDYDIIGDFRAMIRLLTSKGLPAEDAVFSPDVTDYIIKNKAIKELLDIRNVNIGTIAPIELPDGASRIGVINIDGHDINLISYDEQYEDENGELQYFMGEGNVVLTAPASGRSLYGAVSQLEQSDGRFHTYMANRVPKYTADAEAETRTLKVSAKPLPIPKNKNAWIHAKVK